MSLHDITSRSVPAAAPDARADSAGSFYSTDAQLLEAIEGKSARALEALVSRYGIRLHAFLYRLVGDSAGAERLLEELFLDVVRNPRRFQETAAVALFRCAVELAEKAGPSNRWAGIGTSPLALFHAALFSIPTRERAALALHKFETFETSAIAQVLGTNKRTAASILRQAYSRLEPLAGKRSQPSM